MKKTNKNILFTFDYELFLGSKSGSVINCLIKPTDLILKILSKYSIKHAIFFIDTVYLNKLKNQPNNECQNDYRTIKKQLIRIIDENHYIFPHIHAHWIDANYNSEINQWNLSNYSKYRFHNLDFETRDILFSESIKIINEIISESNNKYKVNSYRAGGWSIQPFTDFMPFFEKYEIKYDFSVLKYFENNTEAQNYNFKNCPNKEIYNFKKDPCQEDEKGNFTEFCISSIKFSPFNKLISKIIKKIVWKLGDRSFGDGLSLKIESSSIYSVKSKKRFNREMVSIELLDIIKLYNYKSYIHKNNFIHFISHPKMLSPNNLYCFDRLLKKITRNYKINTDYKSMVN